VGTNSFMESSSSGMVGGRKRLLTDYEQMDQAPLVPHSEVVTFVRNRRLRGCGIGWIGAHLLTSSLVGRLKLGTTDPPLMIIAEELGIAYEQGI
jgi:hypothetical protein